MITADGVPQREFARTGLNLGAVGLGTMGMSWGYVESDRDDARSIELIRAAAAHGTTLIDTADIYGDGHNEMLVGSAIAPIRDQVFLATKGGLVVDDLTARAMHRDGSPAHMTAALEVSLRRLNVDAVDLYYLHRVDPAVSLEETWGAMAELVTAGKARHIGLSEVSPEEADIAQAIHPVAAIQSELSLWTRDPLQSPHGTNGTLGWTVQHGASFVPFAPLGRGYLTGSVGADTVFESSDFRAANPRFSLTAREHNEQILQTVRAIADAHECTPAQVAIAWTLAQASNVIPIPGTRRTSHLLDNVAAATVELTAEDLRQLNTVPAAYGQRY